MRLALAIVLTSAGCDLVFPLRDPVVAPNADANIVFVTSGTFGGNLGGLAGADALCNEAAINAELSGEYVAWLSDATTDAIDRLAGSRGWARVDGQPVADLPADLALRGPLVPILLTESGADVRTASVETWSGSDQDGTVGNQTCVNWTTDDPGEFGRFGYSTSGVRDFTAVTDVTCNQSHRLYCFGIGKDSPVTIEPRSDPVMFTSAQLWPPNSGLEAADAICAADALSAGLLGTFTAAVAPSGFTIASRFPQSRAYMRPDGIHIGAVLTNPTLETFPNVTADKQLVGLEAVWTGGLPGARANSGDTCGDWVGGSPTGIIGDANSVVRTFRYVPADCVQAQRIYCLEN